MSAYLKAKGRFWHLTEEQRLHIQAKVEENCAFVKQMVRWERCLNDAR